VAKTLPDFDARVERMVRDHAQQLGATAELKFRDFVEEAIYRYSRDKPREKVHDWTGNGGYDYELPSDFVLGFSRIITVEHDVGEQTPAIVDARYYQIYRDTAKNYLRFLDRSPGPDETIRMAYTTYHDVTETSGTIEDTDFHAVCCLAASLAALALAERYSEKTSPSIDADSISFRTIADDLRALARQWEVLYRQHIIGTSETIPASSLQKNLDARMLVTGEAREFFFHRRRLF